MPSAQAAPYPPIVGTHLTVSTTTPYRGQTIEVSGALYGRHERVRLTIGGIYVGVGVTDGTGAFDPPLVVPTTLLGPYPLTGIGETSGLSSSLTLTIRALPTSNPVTNTPTSTGGLPFTGADVLGILGVAVLLIGAGATAMVAGRRRRAGVS